MAADSNETRQHFQTRDLDQDMRKAYAETLVVSPKEHVSRLKAENRGILIVLAIVVVAIGCLMFGLFR